MLAKTGLLLQVEKIYIWINVQSGDEEKRGARDADGEREGVGDSDIDIDGDEDNDDMVTGKMVIGWMIVMVMEVG